MTHWIVLSQSGHARSRYWPRNAYHFASDRMAVPVLLAELGRLLPHGILAFMAEGERHVPIAVTGLGQGSLYLGPDGKWLASYAPATLRGYPFQLMDGREGEAVLCIAEDHLTEDPDATPLFDEEGGLAQPVAETVKFLKKCEKNRKETLAATQKLVEAGVIEDWPLTLERNDGQAPLRVQGLFRVSEQALTALDAETLHGLRGGPLSLAYAQMFSTHQIGELTKRAEFLAELQARQDQSSYRLDELFSEDDDLVFDFNK